MKDMKTCHVTTLSVKTVQMTSAVHLKVLSCDCFPLT